MSPPSLKVVLLGHPLGVLLAMGVAAWLGWHCYLNANNGTVFMALVGLGLVLHAMRAFDHRRRYRIWRRDCMAMAGITPEPMIGPQMRRALGVALVIALWAGAIAQSMVPSSLLTGGLIALVGLLVLLLLTKLGMLASRLLRRERPVRQRPVTIAVKRPMMPVPSLRQAYRALPDYAKQVLKERP